MANWKEKGEVPDSEDEEEFESQNNIDCEQRYNAAGNESHDNDVSEGDDIVSGERKRPTATETLEEFTLSQASSVDMIQSFDMLHGKFACNQQGETLTELPGSVKQDERQSIEDGIIKPPEEPMPDAEVDEISKSWVQALSPASSILSSPPKTPIRSSPMAQPLSSPAPRSVTSSRSERRRESSPEQTQPGFEPSDYLPRRQFRERRPEQIHPFLFEQQRYERRMKASHLQPIRIEQSQERHDRRNRAIRVQESEDRDFPDPEEVDVGITEESQSISLDRGSPSQSILVESVHGVVNDPESSTMRREDDDSDQEFPDLPDLFKPMPNPARPKQKKPSKKYSTKTRPKLPSPIRDKSKEPTFDIYDFLSSSPTNSPPIRTGNIRRAMSRVISITSSTASTPVWLDQSSPQFQSRAVVHTPITSAIKPSSHVSPMDLMSDAEDPFADPIEILSSPSTNSSSSSSEDEIVFLKKRMKHVLPASHLRLDQKRKEMREQKLQARSKKLSENRAGVALPVMRGSNPDSSTQPASRLQFLDSDESDVPGETDLHGFLVEHDGGFEARSLFQEFDLGFAIEDDRVDGMLPTLSRKRKAKSSSKQPKAKRAILSSHPVGIEKSDTYQPRITSHLTTSSITARQASKPKCKRQEKTPPKLSIIDVADNSGHFELSAPAFLKVAARSARSRKELARQSPSRKYIRLATREDTADAQSVLQDWRNRKLRPKNVLYIPRSENVYNAYPLSQVSVNLPTKLPPPLLKLKANLHGSQIDTGHSNTRRIRAPRVRQLSMNNFVTNRDLEIEERTSKSTVTINTKKKQRARRNPHFTAPFARSAQLEASQFPVNTLEPKKKTLDAFFRMGRKQPLQRGNLQLNRFLADDDVIHPSIEADISNEYHDTRLDSSLPEVVKQHRSRKRLPKRLDAGAAIYRQPSEPLTSDFLIPSLVEIDTDQGRLLGLGKFGTRYPHHFDILPLQSGIHFHETTFIGSGRLANMMNKSDIVTLDDDLPATSLMIGDKVFVWRIWNEVVSEQIGVCVDWLTEQLTGTIEEPDKNDLTATTTSILDYVQHSISFPSYEMRNGFLLRMSEILEDYASRVDMCQGSISTLADRKVIEITIMLLVLSFRLLYISRMGSHASALRLEEVLQKLASLCIKLLIPKGLEDVRKMYDDLQYLSVRERGIRNDCYIAESWVIIFRVLGSAKIPRSSFWDITNLHLGIRNISSIQDAKSMEKSWLFMFSLLPLSDFDEYGCIASGSRFDLGVDNWPLVQQLVKRVFTLYSTNARQSPSFNDYCRAIVSRCHHLMSKWGWWKCSGIIGVIFDFFASRKLANLRNEEVYKSPQFLVDLTIEALLDVEPEDRCFHIFLKIVAIAIRHQCAVDDNKGIRNLVARILPNHDRQFPKEEAILHRDLSSLRNHHDLLCTVYWAAPPGYGPAITLLEKLVSAARSHNEAFLINLRTWERLARFTLSSIPSRFSVDSYKPFITWQNSFFDSLLEEYVELTRVRRQRQVQSDGAFQSDVDCNRKSTMSCIQAVARSTRETLKCSNSITLRHAMNLDMLCKLFSTGSSKDTIEQELISSAIEILTCYLHQIRNAEPESRSSEVSPDEEDEFDSQGLESDPDWAKEMQFVDDYISPLDRTITPSFRESIRKILHDGPSSLNSSTNYSFIERLTKCWAQLVSVLINFGIHAPKVFLATGVNAVFEGRQRSHCTLISWPLFLGELIEHTKLLHTEIPGFDIASEWMVAVSKPQHELRWENAFSHQMCKQGHFLLSEDIPEDVNQTSFRIKAPLTKTNQQLIKESIRTMQKIFTDKALIASKFGNVSKETLKTKFSSILNLAMSSMQHYLHKLQVIDIFAHQAYVTFVQEIVSQIRSHCSEICPPLEFFFRRSVAYWPPATDPTLYLAGLTSYTLQLSSQREKTRNGLVYYLWNGLRNSLSTTDALYSYIRRISKGAEQRDMLEFLLTDIVPSALKVALDTESGWLACEVYLVAVSRAFDKLALSGQPVGQVMHHMNVLLQHMFNGLCSHYSRFGHSVEAIHPSHQGIMTVIFRFWRACRPHLYNLSVSATPELDTEEIFECFDGFVEAATACFKSGEDIGLRFRHFDIGRLGNDVAIKEMAHEVENNWIANIAHGGIDVRMNDGTVINHCFANGPRDLREVLDGMLPDCGIEKIGTSLDCYF